jgi:hypothetical protein
VYKKYKNKLNHVIKTGKKNYYENEFLKYKNDMKMTWQTINQVLNRNKTREKLPDNFLQKNSNRSITDPIGPQLAKKIPKNNNISHETYLVVIMSKACSLSL